MRGKGQSGATWEAHGAAKQKGRTHLGSGLLSFESFVSLERVQLGQPLLLFLLAGGLVAGVDFGLFLVGVGGGLSRCGTGLDFIHLVGGLGRLFSGGQGGVDGAHSLDHGVGVCPGRGGRSGYNFRSYASAAPRRLKLQGRLGGLVAARRLVDAGGRDRSDGRRQLACRR